MVVGVKLSATAEAVAGASEKDLGRYGGDLFHATLALVLLLVIQVLNIHKPTGLTPYGWRKNQRERTARTA